MSREKRKDELERDGREDSKRNMQVRERENKRERKRETTKTTMRKERGVDVNGGRGEKVVTKKRKKG